MTHFIQKYFSWIRIVSALILWTILLILINFRLDLTPNSIVIDADLQNAFLPPEIQFNTGTDFTITTVESGEATSVMQDRLNAFQVTFRRPPLLTGENLLHKNTSLVDQARMTTWFAHLPISVVDWEEVQQFILVTQGQDAVYSIFTGEVEWQITVYDGLLVADRPTSLISIPESLMIVKTEFLTGKNEDLAATPGIASIIALPEDPKPLGIQSITIGHSFGKLGFQFPLFTWQAEGILASFDLGENEDNYSIDEGTLTLYTENKDYFRIKYPSDPSEPVINIQTKIRLFYLLINLIGAVIAASYFFGLGLLRKKRFQNFSNIHLTPVAALIFLLIGILADLLRLVLIENTLLIISLVGMASALVLDFWVLDRKPVKVGFSRSTKIRKWEVFLLIGFLICAAVLLFFRLGSFDLWEDEFQVVDAAAGFMKTGSFDRWDWINHKATNDYSRAWPHTFLIAQAFRLFGISEWSARLVSVLSGIGFFVLLFFIAKYFSNNQIAFMTLGSAVFFQSYIQLFRYTRMYALLLPMFLLQVFLLYRGLTGETKQSDKTNRLTQVFGTYLNFDYKYLLPVLPLLYLTYLVHVNSLIILLAGFLFVCLLAIIEKKKKYILLALSGAVLGPGLVGILFFLNRSGYLSNNYLNAPSFLGFLSAFEMRNYVYFRYLLYHPFGVIAGITLIILMAYAVYANRKEPELLRKYLYLFTIVVTAAVFFVFVADRYASHFYISHITPFALILVLSGLWYLGRWIGKRAYLAVLLLVCVMMFNFINSVPNLYFSQSIRGNFSKAYQTIVDNYQYGDEVIFGQYLRTFYLRDLDQIEDISLSFNQRYPYERFLEDLVKWDAGWLTWESIKSYHINMDIRTFADTNFRKLHGRGVDDTGVEVYYFTRADYINEIGE